jgi:hypothetical protein
MSELIDRRPSERGEGKLGGIIALLVFVAFCLAVWNVAPHYISFYNLRDEMIEICRLSRGPNPDEAIMDKLLRAVRAERLEDSIDRNNFKIETRDSSRTITLEYQVEGQVLPGWRRVFRFDTVVDEPFF